MALCGFIRLRHRICADVVLKWDGLAQRLEGLGASVGVFGPLFCRCFSFSSSFVLGVTTMRVVLVFFLCVCLLSSYRMF